LMALISHCFVCACLQDGARCAVENLVHKHRRTYTSRSKEPHFNETIFLVHIPCETLITIIEITITCAQASICLLVLILIELAVKIARLTIDATVKQTVKLGSHCDFSIQLVNF